MNTCNCGSSPHVVVIKKKGEEEEEIMDEQAECDRQYKFAVKSASLDAAMARVGNSGTPEAVIEAAKKFEDFFLGDRTPINTREDE